ncbi:MAG: hypothetical protein QOE65_54 [Solirubrobacteraceae bacterium]|jgi:hypothetical protein|nr:hypothetical protein [Solirubrobacteraceae bacterium]
MRRALLFTVLLCLLAPAGASATSRDVIRDCTDNGKIDSTHSQSDYTGALKSLPSDVDEYTECRRIIQSAQSRDARQRSSGGGGTPSLPGGGGTGGPPVTGFDGTTPPPANNAPTTPGETNALNGAAAGAPVAIAGEPITPGGSGVTEAALRHALPGPLLVVLILFGLGALATTLTGARGRGWRAPGPVLRVFDRVFPHRA